MNKLLGGFIWVWASIICLLNLMGIAVSFMKNDFWAAVVEVQEWYSPFNIWNYGLNVILLSPALAAYMWLNRRRKRDE